MRASVWAFALAAVASQAFATRGDEYAKDIKSDYPANPWAVANPYLDKPTSYEHGSVTPDGTCGGSNGYVCKGSAWGDCCGQDGWCGSTKDYCGSGCKDEYGLCGVASPSNASPVIASSAATSASKVTVTAVTHISTTVCPTTMVVTISGTTSESTWMTTSLVTTTLPYSTLTVTEHPSGYSSSPVSPESASSYESGPSGYSTSPVSPVSASSYGSGSESGSSSVVAESTAHPGSPSTSGPVHYSSATPPSYESSSTAPGPIMSSSTPAGSSPGGYGTSVTAASYRSTSTTETSPVISSTAGSPAGSSPISSSTIGTTVTVYTTIYTTTCGATTTLTSGSLTTTSTYSTVSTVTSVVTSTLSLPISSTESSTPVSPISPTGTLSLTSSSPGEYTVTSYTTTYTTKCGATTTLTSGSLTTTSTYSTMSTVTSVVTSTLSLSASSTESSTPISPMSFTGSSTSVSPISPTDTLSLTSSSPGEYTVTSYTTIYTTTCGVTSTVTSSGTTSLTTYSTVSTVTSVISSTITSSATVSSSTSGAVQSGSTSSSSTGSQITTGTTTASPGSYTIISSTPIYRNGSCFTTTINGSVTTITASTTSGSGSIYTSGSSSSYGMGNLTSTGVVGTGTGSVSASSDSSSYGMGNATTSGPVGIATGTGSASISSSSSSYGMGNATSSGPIGIATGTGSASTSSSSSSYGMGNATSSGLVGTGTGTGTGSTPNSYTIYSSTPIYRSGSCFTSTNGSYSIPFPTGTSKPSSGSSIYYPGGNKTTSGMIGSGTASSSISSAHYPVGNGTVTGPTGTGTGTGVFTTSTVPFPAGNTTSSILGSTGAASASYSIIGSYPIYRSDSCFTKSANGSLSSTASQTPSNSANATTPVGPTATSTLRGTGSSAYISNSANATTSVGPTATSTSLGTGTGSSSYISNSANATTSVGPTATSTSLRTGTGSSSYISNSANATTPTGSTSTSPPLGTATGVSSHISNSANATSTTSSSTSTCKSKPTNTDFCIPCQGQPGSDPEEHCGLTVNDDSYESIPKTCRTVEYYMTITNTTIAPDGVERIGLLLNGQYPGPTIEANWGDTVIVHLTNGMQNNGTSLHFHGMRQYHTNEMDGVPSITQCALAPGESMTYKFVADNYGTSWYHSHWGLQTYDGVFGPMVIHGPSSMEYDEDAGPMILQDWNHVSVNELYDGAQAITPSGRSGPPTLDTGLINGKNVWGSGGERFELAFEPGKAYLMRVINCAIGATFKFSIDGHKFWVVSTDFVPIVPYQTDVLNINIGQRYNIIVVADQPVGDYWMRADNQVACSPVKQFDDIKAIVRYQGSLGTTPLTLPAASAAQGACVDEPLASLVPVVSHQVGAQDRQVKEDIVVGPGPATPNLFKWTLNGATFQSQWGDPTLYSIAENDTIPPYSGSLAIEAPNLGEWIYIVIESGIPVPHPIHLHGHDFYVLQAGNGLWNGDYSALQTSNPPRRDVALMPGTAPGPTNPTPGGHLVVAFYTDNPGAWLMHCHIGWHAEMGFALQIVENQAGIKDLDVDTCEMGRTCKAWNKYAEDNHIVVSDSGI